MFLRFSGLRKDSEIDKKAEKHKNGFRVVSVFSQFSGFRKDSEIDEKAEKHKNGFRVVSMFSRFLELRRNWALKILQVVNGRSSINNASSYILCAFLVGKFVWFLGFL